MKAYMTILWAWLRALLTQWSFSSISFVFYLHLRFICVIYLNKNNDNTKRSV